MTFLDYILTAINNVIRFLGDLFAPLFDLISGAFNALMDFLAVPLGWLMWLLEGIFYLFQQLFLVVVMTVKIFTAIFQYLGALMAGVFRTIQSFLTVNPSKSDISVSSTESGFATVIDLLQPTGLLTVVPVIATAFVWLFFALKVFGAFGGTIFYRTPFSSEGKDRLG